MAPSNARLRVLSVGGNAVSAFLSWRLQATNACDVTLVWKASFQTVAQYGISFKSKLFGNERFKPRHVVQNPEDAAGREVAYDYVLLCVKALPDLYNLADIIQSVVTPQHTCIIVNTSNTLGVEKHLEERFPTNVVLSLVSAADVSQLGASEFEHTGSTDIWVGPASTDSKIPQSIQRDMSEALAMTLTTGQVDCKVSDNIRQQQFERMIGPIAFHPVSVIFDVPAHDELLPKPGVRELVTDVIEELMNLAKTVRCSFAPDFQQKLLDTMAEPGQPPSTMYQDFQARRPMEVETYLGSPSSMARAAGVPTPHIDTLYTILRHINTTNKDRPPVAAALAPVNAMPPPPPSSQRVSSHPPPPRSMNGPGGGPGRPMRGGPNGMMPPPGRRGPPVTNGYRGMAPNGYPRGQGGLSRKPSFDDANFDEFSHVVLYDDVADGDGAHLGGHADVALRERELLLRERELQLRQQEMAMRRGNGRRTSHARHQDYYDDDDDDEGDYFDPGYARGPAMAPADADNFDMMSVTSRRTKRAPSQGQLRKTMYDGGNGMPMRPGSQARPHMGRNRTSAQLMADMPMLGGNILDNALMGFSSNRYGTVDRKEMQVESRANSMTAGRQHDMGGAYPAPTRRISRSPGNPLSPGGVGGPMTRGPGRPSPPTGHAPYMPGPGPHGRPSPPGMPPSAPRFPPGPGPGPGPGGVGHPPAVGHEAGVSKPYPPPPNPTKSLTGSASASAGSGDSGSANIESDPSAHSSTSSFAPRAMIHA